jgi:5-oxoprolinase (ATP-hydrolysing) subunit A
VPIDAQTLCLHGDTPGAVRMAEAVRRRLQSAGVEIAPL